ncbi:dispanin subfamily A member 2b-like [Ahaetulla prasina]|uniref:dispanin subfamily A member 2b-like n=1 Tax=Ahaetulla prasina TaxID=499056 RepID=UPI002647F9EA|nr:dispanin subfamily A member 2b-like [Ahaetulla prasina]
MEPQPTEVAMRPTSTYQYPKVASNPAVRDHVIWSLFSLSWCNCCCLGLVALLYSIKSRDRKVLGDPEAAASYGRTAKYLNIAALMITIIVYIIFMIILISSALFILNTLFQIMKLPDEIEEFRGN